MSVVDDAFKIATAGLDFKKKPVDRFRGAYVRQRAEFLHLHNSSWNANRIATQLKAELGAVQDYLAGKNPLINDTEGTPVQHGDLKIWAALTTLSVDGGAFGQRFFGAIEREGRANRAKCVSQIVWKAVAIHSDILWKSLGPPPQLQQGALDEILDRRLLAVETMHFNVNSSGYGKFGRPWKVDGPTGPWRDGFRVRSFEYPWVAPSDPFKPLLPQMQPEWHLDTSLTPLGAIEEVDFDPPNHVRVRVPREVDRAWRLDSGKTWINFHPIPSLTPAEIIEEMFTPREDFWDRSWLFCEHVGSLVNIAALGFATLRRTGSAVVFNDVMKRPNYIRLGPVVGDKHDRDILMADDQDEFFENIDVSMDELQVGDFVRFWNSRLYELLPPYGGAWGSEFSLIMSVEVDGSSGKVPMPLSGGPQIELAGHGIDTQLYNAMAAEATEHLKSRFYKALLIIAASSGDRIDDQGHAYVRWSPYERFDNAWWVEIPKPTWHDEWGYGTQADVLIGVPRTIAREDGGSGYNPPPDSDAVYLPLFEPAVDHTDADGDSWRAYLRLRKTNPSFRLKSPVLNQLTIDGRLAPGLFYRGSKAKIPVVRPKVRI